MKTLRLLLARLELLHLTRAIKASTRRKERYERKAWQADEWTRHLSRHLGQAAGRVAALSQIETGTPFSRLTIRSHTE